jgi:cellulose synthase/poly-beta-1,6-N-acetylglucosamine synthase-like glycosyltransferase
MSGVVRKLSPEPRQADYVPGQRILHPYQPHSLPADPPLAPEDQRLATRLLRDGVLAPHVLLQAMARQSEHPGGRLFDVLIDQHLVEEGPLYAALQRLTGIGRADLSGAADPRLIDRLGAAFCLAERLLPLRSIAGATVIAAADPAALIRHKRLLDRTFGAVLPALAPPARIEAAILAARGTAMARAAETQVAASESCRSFRKASRTTLNAIIVGGLVSLLAFRPILAVLTLWAVLTLVISTGLKLAAFAASFGARPPQPNPAVRLARLPVVSIMVALYRESDIAARLVQRLGRLDYPRNLLDIVLVVEEEDNQTRKALARADLPTWMRIVVTPAGRVKTKPRALNFGLTQCRGSIIGVYDAEDAPEPDQIRRVVQRFTNSAPQVACLQGALDFYNPTKNWLARCFTIEYAGWFRVILPGLQRLGMPLPLGGTTLFFRRDILQRLGGWDAWNVTEDADLGMRLARHGYRTEILDSTTLEEANCRGLPWVKQRSRWIKGYMMTYVTHMRRPGLLYRELGPRGFAGFQILFLGSLSQALFAPLLWSLWFFCLGLGHPLAGILSPAVLTGLTVLSVNCETVNIAVGILGLKRSGQPISALWVPTLALYFPMQAFAAYKAAWEMLHNPFYWDKTTHGSLH